MLFARRAVNAPAFLECLHHLDVRDLHRVQGERVPIKDDEVSEFTGFGRAFSFLLEVLTGGSERHGFERDNPREAMFRVEDVAGASDAIQGSRDQLRRVGGITGHQR